MKNNRKGTFNTHQYSTSAGKANHSRTFSYKTKMEKKLEIALKKLENADNG